MISESSTQRWLVVASGRTLWRRQRTRKRKLESFSRTELGSALDMFKAAELERDPHRRKLFFRHALDELRHAQMFRQAANATVAPDSGELETQYALIHAKRQDLYERMSLAEFLAFVHLAEKRGELHFSTLARTDADLAGLFERIAKDERFHVSYSGRLLQRMRAEGRGREVAAALVSVRVSRWWQASRRMGRRVGDLLSKAILLIAYGLVVPFFAVLERTLDPEKTGWKRSRAPGRTVAELRRKF